MQRFRFRYGDQTSGFAQNNLPNLPGPFIGRDKDVESIIHLLHFAEHSHTKMVHILHIFGLPAVDKSTLGGGGGGFGNSCVACMGTVLVAIQENCGPNATYRNLAKSFYDAGKPHLVETVCAAVMTCDYRSKHTSQKVSISLSRAIPNATAATSSTRISSLGCKCFLLCFVTAIVVILAYNSQRGTHFVSQSPASVSADRSRADMEGIYRSWKNSLWSQNK